ncbi:hypothetical protein SELMODRAFT_102024 [Selaginella moellendorffii]|uniref:Cell cycle checkpoint protein RAD1 n=1 Tax=Selaginella moellendorffii TaxID=88036 RepID=D8RUN9_SELML|nr:cell cycle checkpoint protein RAD1 isoform X1 [Selaginella moellendorffii]EFJ24062.1 hypothetical protein SELMODRAFT_102024 [Selaginella moellendorffii]|eukprot:XP_002974542.1 cell cycle checkpoint protein RAD1 isoform X1 [Selaginella moellendorffii]
MELRCVLDNVQGLVDSLSAVRWKKQQDAICEVSEHGLVIIVEEWGCLQARVYYRKELFVSYEYSAESRPRFGVSLGLLVDTLSTFSSTGTTGLELSYPGSDMQLLLKLTDADNTCIYAEIRTKVTDTVPKEYSVDGDGGRRAVFAVKSAALKEAIDDLEWPGSSISITISPDPAGVILRGEGHHGDLQIDFPYDAHNELFAAFQCQSEVSYSYKYKFLRATTANVPNSVTKDNRGSKLTIGAGGLLKVQHLISLRQAQQHNMDPNPTQQGRVSYVEFYLMPDEEA